MEARIYNFINVNFQRNLLCISPDSVVIGRKLGDTWGVLSSSFLVFGRKRICEADNWLGRWY